MVGAVGNIFSDILVIGIADLISGVQIGNIDRYAVLIRGKEQIHMAVIELHIVVITSQDLQITHYGCAVRIALDGNGILRCTFLRGYRNGRCTGFERIQSAGLIHPRNRGVG